MKNLGREWAKKGRMKGSRWEIGICGTFDVANYGDLLFPLIAESELRERLGAGTLRRFSYYSKASPQWPYEVTSITELPQLINQLDGLLIGGGFLIRFDTEVAPGYAAPAPEIHHPTGYWLTPALIALQSDVPLVWNAPGTDGKHIPRWAEPLLTTALTLSRYVSVRDESSRMALQPLTNTPVVVVPDTAFGIPRLLNLERTPSSEFMHLCKCSGLDRPYIVIQAKKGAGGFVRLIKKHPEQLRDFQFLVLPIGPVLGDDQAIIDADLPSLVRLPYWPNPLVIAELIGRSEAVVGESYHLCITALASGVPVFARDYLPTCKYSVLQHSGAYFVLPPNGEPDLEWFLTRVGRTQPLASARSNSQRLCGHWDRIASAVREENAPTSPKLKRFWQSIPTLLEGAATRENEAVAALVPMRADQERLQESLAARYRDAAETHKQRHEQRRQMDLACLEETARQDRLDHMTRELTMSQAETAARNARIAEIMTSLSWKLTAPLRFAGLQLLKFRRRRLMNLEYIRRHQLETEPYRWAAINNLFTRDDAARLAATYPVDYFKLVASYGAERHYEYEARSLIRMGADVISHPEGLSDVWRALAMELLSQEYRAAMADLTSCDLSHAPLEVNVFHYGPGNSLSPHRDLPEKVLTHVLYFNRSWDGSNGGCLRILRSADPADVAAEIPPLTGHSSVIVRSDNSWHAVSRVGDHSVSSRRSVTVTFYRPGAVSTMWPPDDTAPLHRYHAADLL